MGLMLNFVCPSPPPMESRYLAEAQQRLAARLAPGIRTQGRTLGPWAGSRDKRL
jgi:hypothetical protein